MTALFQQPAAGWANPPLTGLAAEIANHVSGVIRHGAATDPRNMQKAIGPSGIGTPCVRRLAYELTDWDPKPNADTDPLASIIGKAGHAWLEATFAANNPALPDGRPRYLLEHRVHADASLSGSSDLLDRYWNAVIDWKFPGVTAMEHYRKDQKPGLQYQVQAHTYGYGFARQGERVDHVAIVFIPRAGRLDGMWVWTESFQPLIAQAALQRRDNVLTALMAVDPDTNPQAFAAFPATESYCTFCPWFLPGSTDLSRGCPGAATK